MLIPLARLFFFTAAFCAVSLSTAMARAGQPDGDQGTLLLAEARGVFLLKPTGGELHAIPHDHDIYSARGIQGSQALMIETRDDNDAPVFRELSLSGNVVVEYPHPVGVQSRSLSPDGQQYLYVKTLYGEVVLHDVRKNISRVLFDPLGSEAVVHLGWSADQRIIVFVLRQLNSERVCLMLLDSDFDRDKCFGTWVAYPSLSPDGKMLAYWERTPEAANPIWTMNVQEIGTDGLLGKPERTFSKDFKDWKYGKDPIGPIRWSPDGRWLVFSIRDDPTDPFYQLLRMKLDSSEVEAISLNRPWWKTFWRRYLVPMEKNGFGTDFQWLPYRIHSE